MRKLLLATASFAMLAGAAQAQDASWTGPYVGVSAGLADRNEKGSESVGFDTNLDGAFNNTVNNAAGANAFSPGFCGGSYQTNAAAGGCRKDDDTDVEWSVRAGYDYQIGSFVVGGLVEYTQVQLNDAVTAFSITPAGYSFNRKLNDLWAVRARGGYAMGDNLFYATGGYARGNMKHSFNTTNTVNSFTRDGGGDANGYQIGLGYERKLMPNVTVGVEWLRTSLKDDDYTVRAGNAGATPATNPFLLTNTAGTDFLRTSDKFKFDSYRVTASYRF